MKTHACEKTKYIEREIKVTFILFGVEQNLGKTNLTHPKKEIKGAGETVLCAH